MHHADDPLLPPEEVVTLDDPITKLRGWIVLDSTRLGSAAGGCRVFSYPSREAASRDALRLARGMTFKNALAGLPLGGGKAVIQLPPGAFDRAELLRAFGRAVARLGGRYVTAEDVGTSVADMTLVAETTRHVAGLARRPGHPGGDPSPWTALGVFKAMEVAVRVRLGTSLEGLGVGVQGLGNVGYALCALLHESGARLIVAEPRADVAARAERQFGALVVGSTALLHAPIDVFAPCAMGGAIDLSATQTLRAKIVCGAANNQLYGDNLGQRLAERGILYAPDYLVNAGGIISVAAEYLGWPESEVERRTHAIADRLRDVLQQAERLHILPLDAANAWAQAAIRSGTPCHDLAA